MKVQTRLGEVRVKWVRNWRGCTQPPRRFITSCYILMPTGERFVGLAVKHPKDRYHAGIAQYWALRRAVEEMVKRIRRLEWEPRRDVLGMVACIGSAFWQYARENWGTHFTEVQHMKMFTTIFAELWPLENNAASEVAGNTALRDDQRELLKAWEVLKEGVNLPLAQDVRIELYSDGSGEVLPAHSRAVIGRHFNIVSGKSPVNAIRTERDSLRGQQ